MSDKKETPDAVIIPFKSHGHRERKTTPAEDFKEKFHKTESESLVVDLSERRNERVATDRRNVTRTVLSQFIGVFLVLPSAGLKAISVYDISDGGLSFDLANEFGNYKGGDSLTLRIYLSHDTYFSFQLDIVNSRPSDFAGSRRHGAIFKKHDDSYNTLVYFAKFLQNVSSIARKDHGDLQVGRID
jgi:hypothetical protein